MTYQGGGVGPNNSTHYNMLRTANMTREDFNIEDLHVQVVAKMQRQRRVLKEIEQTRAERELDEQFFMDESTEMYPSAKKGQSSSNARNSSKQKP
jgi:hypothetical protein